MNETPIELFRRWYVNPIVKLKELPDGDGGFAAFMIALPLYERYIDAKLKLENKPTDNDSKLNEIAIDLKLNLEESIIFKSVFRAGFMHQAMPKTGKTKWITHDKYKAIPEFKTINGINYVCINPWKFADRVLNKFISDHRLITVSESFPLASIFSLPK